MDPQVEKLMKALEGLVAMVSEASLSLRTIATDAFSPYDLLEISSINLDLLNIESIATEMEQHAIECQAVLDSCVEPAEEDNVDPEDLVPFDWEPKSDADYYKPDSYYRYDSDKSYSNGQRRGSFWKRIQMKYNAKKDATYSTRTERSLEGRRHDIKEQVSKFEGYYHKVHRENRSSYVDSDKVRVLLVDKFAFDLFEAASACACKFTILSKLMVVTSAVSLTTEAVTLYNSLEPRPFIFMHCWKLLRTQPKWTDLQDKANQADSHIGSEPEDVDSVSHGQGDASASGTKRPLGRDSSKATKKASSSQSLDELIQIDRQKLAMKSELLSLKRAKEDERILGIDLSSLTPLQRVMMEKLQREVFARWSGVAEVMSSSCSALFNCVLCSMPHCHPYRSCKNTGTKPIHASTTEYSCSAIIYGE
ncbi:hypothetical protein BAE44_0010259 [Dichanthelium oligosanthes]|uniref:No apical meristem-associated C-terminal domain-containing protein n=1 Tax=Dichanthelium oligosanthes TaxID=888268 RepID=A0A1E5VUF0_9POAL|nr:hypothetical protein BAE44_0010259 [Dichanthelium oligosanthes]